jgi:hypothetical protein
MDGKDDKSKNEKKSVTEKYAADPNTAGTGISNPNNLFVRTITT